MRRTKPISWNEQSIFVAYDPTVGATKSFEFQYQQLLTTTERRKNIKPLLFKFLTKLYTRQRILTAHKSIVNLFTKWFKYRGKFVKLVLFNTRVSSKVNSNVVEDI